jgi:hypothetical protein
MQQWLAELSSQDHDLLRLLTKDLTAISQKEQHYPKFNEVVIRMPVGSDPDSPSRQRYLQEHAPMDLWDQVMQYWQTQLKSLVPDPQFAQKSNYDEHARWMAALKELAPADYQALLAQWRSQYKRRTNLWKAMKQQGLRS